MPFFTKDSYNGTGVDFCETFVDFEVFEDCEVTYRDRPELTDFLDAMLLELSVFTAFAFLLGCL